MSFPASNSSSRIHSEFILATLSCSPLAVTVTVTDPQNDHYILLRQEGGGCILFPPDQHIIHHFKSSLNASGSIFELISR